MEISVSLSNFQLLQKLHFVSPEQLAAAKEGGNECSSAGKIGRDGDIQSSANQHSAQPPSVVTAHHNLFSGLHEQGSHFYIAQFRSALQRKQAVGESVMQTQKVDWLEGTLNLGQEPEAVAHCALGEKGACTDWKEAPLPVGWPHFAPGLRVIPMWAVPTCGSPCLLYWEGSFAGDLAPLQLKKGSPSQIMEVLSLKPQNKAASNHERFQRRTSVRGKSDFGRFCAPPSKN